MGLLQNVSDQLCQGRLNLSAIYFTTSDIIIILTKHQREEACVYVLA